ncbi:PaaI family thioesterase, partial [Micromonospora sp. NPDC050495]|uniref:PaaI family thioesterase n=1 Tax=Micromonospora sp. NPDC050495 TaxID=3154936 RepID=UPI003407DC85
RDDLLQHDGYLHGGVLSYAADNAITFAAGSVLGPAVLTSGLTVSYLRPAAQGRTLRARATVVHAGRRQAVCRCDLLAIDGDEPGTLCAVAQGTVLTRQSRPQPAGEE